MKAYERRAAGKETYWKLQRWDAVKCCWIPYNRQFESEGEAMKAASKPGRYRVSEIKGERNDLQPFDVV